MADCFPPPAFFKILLDPTASHLPLPHAFVSKHLENKIPKNPTLQSATGGYSWQLTIERIDKSYCFSHGWKKFVQDAQLGFGDFLVFRLVHQSIFKVSIFGTNGCEKYLPSSKIKIEDDVDVDDDDATISDDVNDDDDDCIVYEGGKDEEEEEEEEDDDEDDEEENEEEEEEEEEEDDDDDDVNDGDDDDVDDGGIDGNEGDPFFMITISKTHNNFMRLPSEFVELAGIGDKRTITMKNLDEQEWQLGLRSEKPGRIPRYHVSVGWPNFRRSNELLEGDECVFKYIKSEGKLSLVKVTKKKPVARKSPVKIPAKEVVTRERGRPAVVRQPPAEIPATNMVQKKRGRPFKNRSPVEVEVEVVQRIPSKKSRVVYF